MLALLAAGWIGGWIGGWAGGAAGGWATTTLDPAPGSFAAGTSYTLGFWVLQHGTHPFEGDLRTAGLRFTRDDGRNLMFPGTPLPEAGHYAASVVLPEGTWRIEGIQGLFRPDPVGTLSVPGALEAEPVPKDLVSAFVTNGRDYWEDVRPPGFPDLPGPTVRLAPTAVPPSPAPSPAAPPEPEPAGGLPAYTLVIAAAGGAALTAAALRLTTRRPGERPTGEDDDPPRDPSAETIVISG
ncbi:hypothetical protein [Nonomuraea sp. NPDC050783]|uniref:hypothetical protein n=1 Tax=Nonomuraea sp. NPDC050783 TaxID=3154634 RepID=UPI0034661859